MKRFVSVVLALLLLVAPVSATSTYVDDSIRVTVNGSPVSSDVVMHNNSVFVPLRFMSNQLDAQVNWDSKNRTVAIKKANFLAKSTSSQVVITGSEEFKDTINSSLSLLKTKAPDKYKMITNNLATISQGTVGTSVAKMNLSNSTCIVDLTVFENYSKNAKFSNTDKKIFLAGILVHESHHAMMFNQGLFGYANAPISSFDAEVLAHAYTRQTIKALGASQKLMSMTSVDYIVDANYQGVN